MCGDGEGQARREGEVERAAWGAGGGLQGLQGCRGGGGAGGAKREGKEGGVCRGVTKREGQRGRGGRAHSDDVRDDLDVHLRSRRLHERRNQIVLGGRTQRGGEQVAREEGLELADRHQPEARPQLPTRGRSQL